jgi:uncharacterized protein YraI
MLKLALKIVSTALAVMLVGPSAQAFALPTTPLSYPAGSTATRFTGLAFDTCTAPTVAQMTAWKSSPYKAIGVYIGGPNRTCAQPQLTPSWVTTVTAMGWRLIPIYMGRQAPCTFRANAVKMSTTAPGNDGVRDAADAVAKAKALGIQQGSAIYGDMEHYDATNTSCRSAVLRYLTFWTTELHRQSYLSGVYAHQDSGAKHLASVYNSTSYARPDALWIARWDLNSSLTGWPTVPNAYWAIGQRGKQYRGDHNETYGGVTLNIDSDRFDAPVATVRYRYTATATLNARTDPSKVYPVVASYPKGTVVNVVCQTWGPKVGTTTVWNRLSTGSYVSDYYITTPSNTTYSAPLPKCVYPFQTTVNGLSRRSGPGTSYSVIATTPIGSLAWIVCQRAGSTVGTTSVWDRLIDSTYVTDYYVATASNTTYTAPIRRC